MGKLRRKLQNGPRRNLYLVMMESTITAGLLAMPIMTLFFQSIGLNQAEIALSQSIFTVIIALANLPTGWIADRFSRKWANVIGDFGVAIILMFYARTETFAGVVICESLLGIAQAFSQGVDLTLLRHFSRQTAHGDFSPEHYFDRQVAKLSLWQNFSTLILMLLGGVCGAISFRLAIAMSGAVYFCAGVISLLIVDDSEKLPATEQNPLRGIGKILDEVLHRPALYVRILAFAFGRETTHVGIWVLSPLLLAVGFSLESVALFWALGYVVSMAGAGLARRFGHRITDHWKLLLPTGLMMVCASVLAWRLNSITVWFYLGFNLIQGWTSATLMPMVQRYAAPSVETTIISLARVVAQIVYIPAVYLVGLAADRQLNRAMLAVMMIFAPTSLLISLFLKRTVE